MAEYLEIEGGRALNGVVKAGGAKNAALPLLMASLLTGERVRFDNVPNLEDLHLALHLLERFGAEWEFSAGAIIITTPRLVATEASYSLVKALRASFWVLGPLLARGRAARVALPGGDIIGARPVDLHLAALEKMGADISVKHGVVYASAPSGLKAAEIDLRFPSVGATHQVMMAAALTEGRTVIRGAACEPEIAALGDMLQKMGASVEGAGTPTVVVQGREELGGADIHLIGDRIEAATYLLAGAATRGCVRVDGIRPEFFGDFLGVMREMGMELEFGDDWISASCRSGIKGVNVVTAPFPGFATDIQAPLMAALCVADGPSTIEERVFDGRFGHVSELCRMGARIAVTDRTASIEGGAKLSSAPVEARDIRAGASLVIAALAAEGVTKIYDINHIRRGYEYLERKLRGLGAAVAARLEDAEDSLTAGC